MTNLELSEQKAKAHSKQFMPIVNMTGATKESIAQASFAMGFLEGIEYQKEQLITSLNNTDNGK